MKPPHCQGCPLYGQPGPVGGEGSREYAQIVYIGQNPGSEEIRAGRPFIGPSGNVLNRQLYQVGLERSELYITNQVKCLTPDNRLPTPQEVAHCRPFLQTELTQLKKVKVVVLGGSLAFKENVGTYSTIHTKYKPTDNIMMRRGCVEIKEDKAWVGVIHPAAIMRIPELRQTGPDDLAKVQQLASAGLPPSPKLILHPTDSEVKDYVHYILTETKSVADDVETHQVQDVEEDDYVGGDFEVDIIGLSADGHSAIVTSRAQSHLIQPIFAAGPSIVRYEHNRAYEQFHYERLFPEDVALFDDDRRGNRLFDTMIAAHYHRSYCNVKLKPNVISTYTNLPYYDRGLEKLNRRLYNAYDCLGTYQAAINLKKALKQWDLEQVFEEYGMGMIPECEEWRRLGLRVDLRKVFLFKRFMQYRIDKAAVLISKICGPMFNHRSSDQLKILLYEKWNLPKQYTNDPKTKQKKLTTNYEARQTIKRWIQLMVAKDPSLQDRFKVPMMFLTILDYIKGEEKKIEFLGRVSPDGKIHPYFKIHGVESFRLSSSPNVQNIPVYDISDWGGARAQTGKAADPLGIERKKMGSLRSIVIPDRDEDWILTCDFEQLQLWIYAAQFKVKWLLDLFESKDYIYGLIYEHLYKESFFDRSKAKPGQPMDKSLKLDSVLEQRIRRAKAVPLGFLFGRSADAVAAEYGWPLEEGVKLRRWFFGLNPEIEDSHRQIEGIIRQKGWVRHIFKNVMHFPAGKVSEAVNSHAQSPEAFIVMKSIMEIAKELRRRRLRERGNRLMLSVHDSISLNVTERDASEIYEDIVDPILTRPIPELGGFRLRHSAEMSKMWDYEVIKYEHWKHQRSNFADRPGRDDRAPLIQGRLEA